MSVSSVSELCPAIKNNKGTLIYKFYFLLMCRKKVSLLSMGPLRFILFMNLTT